MSKKQGLHGIKAFLVVVGSGVAAGLLVVWIISGIVKAFVSTASEGLAGSAATPVGPPPTKSPVSSLEPGSFDLCQDVEGVRAFGAVYQERLDDGSNFVDTGLEGGSSGVREISNKCSWSIIVGGMVESEMSLSYESKIGGSPVGLEELYEDAAPLVGEVLEEGDIGELPDGGRYVYGVSGGDEIFILVGVVKNTSFSFVFKNEAVSGESLETEYKALVLQVIPVVREILDRSIPD
ncbi:hypothetical protein [Thermobifida cellulosilytica]|uniref:hypothetical protein n=1 Tax=Thermobifida cellulosilytica TaxID=144786 RepID=UPI000A7D501C|nr:hypothetical protein [Thermobifida cellulosilytica]